MSEETFTDGQVEDAIESFLEYGEQSFVENPIAVGHGQGGYYSDPGWAARCLRWHLERLKAARVAAR